LIALPPERFNCPGWQDRPAKIRHFFFSPFTGLILVDPEPNLTVRCQRPAAEADQHNPSNLALSFRGAAFWMSGWGQIVRPRL